MKDDEWETPTALYQKLCEKYNFNPTLDVAANVQNRKTRLFLTDAYLQEWVVGSLGDVWCNPPHSKPNLSRFVQKAEEQHIKHSIRIMMIVPANFGSTATFHKLIQGKRFFEFVEGRPKFEKKGKTIDPSRNAYIVIIWK